MAKFEKYIDKSVDYRWRFRANNGLIIAVSSEGYEELDDLDRSIQIVKQQAPGADVEWED